MLFRSGLFCFGRDWLPFQQFFASTHDEESISTVRTTKIPTVRVQLYKVTRASQEPGKLAAPSSPR